MFTTLSCATGTEFPGSVLGRTDAGNLLLLADLDPPANLNLKRPWYYAAVSSVSECSVRIKQRNKLCNEIFKRRLIDSTRYRKLNFKLKITFLLMLKISEKIDGKKSFHN